MVAGNEFARELGQIRRDAAEQQHVARLRVEVVMRPRRYAMTDSSGPAWNHLTVNPRKRVFSLDMTHGDAHHLVSNPEEWGVVHLRISFTKELDPATGFTYMFQRWFLSEVGVFASRALYPASIEHPFSFALNSPLISFDASGRIWESLWDIWDRLRSKVWGSLPGGGNFRPGKIVLLDKYGERAYSCYVGAHLESQMEWGPDGEPRLITGPQGDPRQNALRHCIWQCKLTENFGPAVAKAFGDAHEAGSPNDADHQSDLINNKIGRGCGADRDDKRSCGDKCHAAWDKGRLAKNQ